MKTTTINCAIAGLALVGLQGCAIQGADSFTPTGATVNRSVRVGTDAFKPNPFEAPKQIVREVPVSPVTAPAATTVINNNIYTQQKHEPIVRPPALRNGPGLIVIETPPRPEDQWN